VPADAPADRIASHPADGARPVEGAASAWRALLLRPFRFDGRLGRGEYVWSIVLWHVVCSIGATLLVAVVMVPLSFSGDARVTNAGALGTVGLAAAVYLTGLASYAVRRLHDLGRSGAWVLLGLVPFANVAFGLALLVAPGAAAANAYGDRTFTTQLRVAVEASTAVRAEAFDDAYEEGRRFAERQRGAGSG